MTGPLTALLDHQEIADRVTDLGLGLDLRDFGRYRRCFADEVEIVNPHFSPGSAPARRCPGEEWARSVYRTQEQLDYCLHTLSSPAIDLHGDHADVTVLQQARFGLAAAGGQRSYQVGGPLRLQFTRTAAGWRIRRLEFTVTWSEGDRDVYALARDRAARAAVVAP